MLAGVTASHGGSGGVRVMGPIDVNVGAPTDYFDKPGGAGKRLGTLEKDRKVALFECRDDGWCSISGGWVLGLDPGRVAAAGAGGGVSNVREICEDTDLYDDREGEKIGDENFFLAAGKKVTVVGDCGNDWCQIADPKGWAWGGHMKADCSD
jgi:hypothetical protein